MAWLFIVSEKVINILHVQTRDIFKILSVRLPLCAGIAIFSCMEPLYYIFWLRSAGTHCGGLVRVRKVNWVAPKMGIVLPCLFVRSVSGFTHQIIPSSSTWKKVLTKLTLHFQFICPNSRKDWTIIKYSSWQQS